MAISGVIALEAQSEISISWDAMLKDTRYGEVLIQRKIDDIKFRVFGTIVTPGNEATTYTRNQIAYVGKLVAIELINPAIEFWQDFPSQKITSAHGDENVTFLRRIDDLRKLKADLIAQTRDLEDDLEIPQKSGYAVISPNDPPLITPDPWGVQDPFTGTTR